MTQDDIILFVKRSPLAAVAATTDSGDECHLAAGPTTNRHDCARRLLALWLVETLVVVLLLFCLVVTGDLVFFFLNSMMLVLVTRGRMVSFFSAVEICIVVCLRVGHGVSLGGCRSRSKSLAGRGGEGRREARGEGRKGVRERAGYGLVYVGDNLGKCKRKSGVRNTSPSLPLPHPLA